MLEKFDRSTAVFIRVPPSHGGSNDKWGTMMFNTMHKVLINGEVVFFAYDDDDEDENEQL